MTDLRDPIYHNDEAARLHLEAERWPNGPYCPRCGECENVRRLAGKSTAPGLCFCNSCRTKFSVTMGTVFERSHIPLSKWMLGFRLMASSKKGISALQLQRTLDLKSYKSAWFLAHRIREAMALPAETPSPMGGECKVVEADETFVGGKEKNKRLSKRNPKNIGAIGKSVAFTLVERSGRARSFYVANVSGKTLRPIIVKHVHRSSTLFTDDAGQYRPIGMEFARHESVNHGIEEYVRVLLDPEARRLRHVPPHQRGASTPLSRGIRLSLQHPCRPWGGRYPAHRRSYQGLNREAPHLSAD